MMKRFILAAILLCSLPLLATQTIKVNQSSGSPGCASSTLLNCASSAFTATAAGDVIAVAVMTLSTGNVVSAPTSGCSTAPGWQTGPTNAQSVAVMAEFYCLNADAGVTTVTATMSVSGAGRRIFVATFSYTGTLGITLDSSNGTNHGAGGTTVAGATLSGSTGDFLVQFIQLTSNTISSIDTGFNIFGTATTFAGAYLPNTTTFATPTWTMNTTGAATILGGMAFKEVVPDQVVKVNLSGGTPGCASSTLTSCTSPTFTATAAADVIAVAVDTISGSASAPTTGCAVSWLNGPVQTISTATISLFYCLNASAGVTSITSTVTSGAGRRIFVLTYSYSGLFGVVAQTSSGTTFTTNTIQPGANLTSASIGDFMFQCTDGQGNTVNSIDTGYTIFGNSGAFGCAYLVNTSTTATPNWTWNVSTPVAVVGVAFKEPTSSAAMIKRKKPGVF